MATTMTLPLCTSRVIRAQRGINNIIRIALRSSSLDFINWLDMNFFSTKWARGPRGRPVVRLQRWSVRTIHSLRWQVFHVGFSWSTLPVSSIFREGTRSDTRTLNQRHSFHLTSVWFLYIHRHHNVWVSVRMPNTPNFFPHNNSNSV